MPTRWSENKQNDDEVPCANVHKAGFFRSPLNITCLRVATTKQKLRLLVRLNRQSAVENIGDFFTNATITSKTARVIEHRFSAYLKKLMRTIRVDSAINEI